METYFPGRGNRDDIRENAIKHCVWMCDVASQCSKDTALEFGRAHEDYPGNPEDKKGMDLNNNEVGAGLGSSGKGWHDCLDACKKAADDGKLKWISNE